MEFQIMTLMDAPKFDAVRERRHKHIVMAVFLLAILCAVGTWWFWNWPEERHVNAFMTTVESGDLSKAYGIWEEDQDWQKHPELYKSYGFDRFQKDWGVGSQYGTIQSFKFVLSRSWGNGVITGVRINGATTPIFLWVDRKTKAISFSPVELYRPNWDTRWDTVTH